jgi:hypothetical protein
MVVINWRSYEQRSPWQATAAQICAYNNYLCRVHQRMLWRIDRARLRDLPMTVRH